MVEDLGNDVCEDDVCESVKIELLKEYFISL